MLKKKSKVQMNKKNWFWNFLLFSAFQNGIIRFVRKCSNTRWLRGFKILCGYTALLSHLLFLLREVGGSAPRNRALCHCVLRYTPYSGYFLGLCEHILLQTERICLVFRNKVLQALKCAVRHWFEVCWKVLILAHRMVGQTSDFDHLESTSLHL